MEHRHVHHAYYASLPDFDARLRASILGRPDLEIEFPNIAARFAPYMEWLDSPEVLKVHFEDLIHDRTRALERIIDHFLARVRLTTSRQSILAALETSIDPRRSPTFRSGKTGEWRNYFSVELKDLFKSVTGALLLKLGYEADDKW
jgi:hypothetical protein